MDHPRMYNDTSLDGRAGMMQITLHVPDSRGGRPRYIGSKGEMTARLLPPR